MEFKNLISNSNIDSPFLFWQGITKESVVSYLDNNLNTEINFGKTFFHTKKEEVILFFQIQISLWDTDHFGYKCASIKHLYIDEKLDFKELDEIINKIKPLFYEHIRHEKIKFILADIPARNSIITYFVQSLGFQFILNWIEGIYIPDHSTINTSNIAVAEITPDEIEDFSSLASDSYYKEGRFYLDKRFDVNRVNSMYGNLVKNCYKSGDIILTYRKGDIPIGIFIYKKVRLFEEFNNIRSTSLRFFLINPLYRNISFGYNIFLATLQHLTGISDVISTGLETHNYRSLNLHCKIGFKMTFSHNAFHFWSEE